MAYVSKELKAKVAAELKTAMPQGWKHSLAVRDHCKLVLTISKAPLKLVDIMVSNKMEASKNSLYGKPELSRYVQDQYFEVSEYLLDSLDDGLQNRYLKQVFTKLFEILNTDNYNNSDMMSDYHEVGHYVELQIGKWDRPFQVI